MLRVAKSSVKEGIWFGKKGRGGGVSVSVSVGVGVGVGQVLGSSQRLAGRVADQKRLSNNPAWGGDFIQVKLIMG